jgi:hypothetical protein
MDPSYEIIRDTIIRDASRTTMDELLNATDRHAAIVGATLVESALDARLDAALVDDQGTIQNTFRQKRDKWAFAKKIEVAYCLRMFGPNTLHNLSNIREVRNRFAHNLFDINLCSLTAKLSFVSPMIQQLCSDLRIPTIRLDPSAGPPVIDVSTHRGRFLYAVMYSSGSLMLHFDPDISRRQIGVACLD